jgi:4-amino-4-deoxy-L-arabinose transferase-like glycosyltransferase
VERRHVPFLVALVCAALLWSAGAVRKSLWSDEFHSLHHVRAGDWASFLEAVRSDNHPPLAFALQRASAGLLGESELALRLPSLLAALLALVFVQRLALRLPALRARALAPGLVACSSYLFTIATEARMYALLALCVLGLTSVLLDWLEGRGSRWWVGAWVALGLHTHYYFGHDLLVLAGCTLGVALARRELRSRVLALLPPAAYGLVCFLPWAAWGFVPQLFHGLPPGGHLHGPAAFVQSLAHFAFTHTSQGGGFLRFVVALPGVLIVALLGCLGVRELARARECRLLLAYLGAVGFLVPAWALACAQLFERAGYGWSYVAGSAAPVLLLVAAGVTASSSRLVLGAGALGTLLASTLVLVAWGGTEDYRAATRFVLASARAGDGLVAKPLWDRDPARSPTGWDYYLARSEHGPGPVPLALPFDQLARVREHPRVWALVRDEHSPWILRTLRESFAREQRWRMGTRLDLYLFSESRAARPTGA